MGPTSIAYLLLWISFNYPELKVEGKEAKEWCGLYLDCGQENFSVEEGNGIGIKNEFLTWSAVKCAFSGESGEGLKWVRRLLGGVKRVLGSDKAGKEDNELLSGRAGTLVLLRIAKHFVPEGNAYGEIDELIEVLIRHIVGKEKWMFGWSGLYRCHAWEYGDHYTGCAFESSLCVKIKEEIRGIVR
jgi:hypothetical protein